MLMPKLPPQVAQIFGNAKSWVRANRTEATLGAVALVATAYWIHSRRSKQPASFVSKSLASGGFRTGIQSSSPMYDARFEDYDYRVPVYPYGYSEYEW